MSSSLVSDRLAPTLVYDDGCHLVSYVRKRTGKDLTETDALKTLAVTPISVDRMHFRNHVGRFCRLEMNPNKNPCMCVHALTCLCKRFSFPVLKGVNTQAAEQCFSWLGRYSAILSSMNWLRAPVYMIILFHSKNLAHVNRRPSEVFRVVGNLKINESFYDFII